MNARLASRQCLALLVAGLLAVAGLWVPGLASPHAPHALFVAVPADRPVPRLDLSAHPTAHGTWLVILRAEHFTFSDLCGLYGPKTMVGHAHIYVDGIKVGAAHLPHIDIGALSAGERTLSATLHAGDHRAYIHDSAPITARVTVQVP